MHNFAKTIFVLGGPACGKGTACKSAEKTGKFFHISAGELLREQLNSELSAIINQHLLEGKIVPAKITVKLLELKMKALGWSERKFLIDGFPRNKDNYDTWVSEMKEAEIEKVIYMKCDFKTTMERMMSRNEGREDDSFQILEKRYNTFLTQTLPVIEEFRKMSILREIDCSKTKEETYNNFINALNN